MTSVFFSFIFFFLLFFFSFFLFYFFLFTFFLFLFFFFFSFLGSGPEGVDELCFHTYGEFSPPPPPPPSPYPPPPPSLQAHILASRPISQPRGPNPREEAQTPPSRLGFGPGGLDLSLETGIWASRLEFGPQDWNLMGGTEKKEEEKEEKKKEKIPYMCERIGLQPLWGRFPKRASQQ